MLAADAAQHTGEPEWVEVRPWASNTSRSARRPNRQDWGRELLEPLAEVNRSGMMSLFMKHQNLPLRQPPIWISSMPRMMSCSSQNFRSRLA